MDLIRRSARLAIAGAILIAPPALSAQVTETEYAARRAALTAKLGDGVYLALGAREPGLNHEAFFQAYNFRYLTGFLEPGSALIVVRKNGRDTPLLFVPPKDPAQEVWTGERLGVDAVKPKTGMAGRDVRSLRAVLDSVLTDAARLMVVADLSRPAPTAGADVPVNAAPRSVDDQFVDHIKERFKSLSVVDASRDVLLLRGRKSPAEVELIRMAAKISAAGHTEALRAIEPGVNEFEIQALAEYTFRRNGGDRPGYPSIVGSGPNSTTLHYNRDDRYMQAGEVVNMDMSTFYGGYSADITRTVPVSGTFSAEQRAIYEIVLAAQKAAERQIRIGARFNQLSDSANAVLREGLARVGLIEGPSATFEAGPGRKVSQLSLFYMHGLGHPIGLDVHDADAYTTPSGMIEGSAFSIEPGIYVRANTVDLVPDTPANAAYRAKLATAVKKYADIGVRIEDDYVVTATGFDRVSADAPREIADIEREMAKPATVAARDAAMVEAYRKIRP
ncbi:MAG: Xaa-Pro aminopeptidase [Gemmatimonadota bacterium]|nr:Xaa-Pro aminopeptidase [Gemmatimonadota bacterium]